MACKEQFRPEVFARFTHVVIYNKLSQEAQLRICTQMLTEEVAAQNTILSKEFGHSHEITIGDGVYRRLISEGYHRELGVRPMRNAVERRVRNAICTARCRGTIVAGVKKSQLILREDGIVLLPVRQGLQL
jgi:ATP-dependent Clp protease ATP-binding subunit ClpB